MKRRILKWYYNRQFFHACRTLRNLSERHRDAGHEVHFSTLNDSQIHLSCVKCPESQPLRRKPEDVVHITRDKFGHPYYP